MSTALLVILGIVLLIAILVIGMYNGLVSVRNHCDEAWSNIDTELQRRYDLIPNLVETAKGYAKHERELLEDVVNLREKAAGNHGAVSSQAADESLLQNALGGLS